MTRLLHIIITCLFVCAFRHSASAQTSYSLQQALTAAKNNNPDLKAAYYNTAIADADIVSAGLRPNLTLNNQTLQVLNHSNYYPNTNWGNSHNRQVWWQLTKTFQVAGQRQNKIDFASKNAELTKKSYEETERNTLLTVAEKWLEVWMKQKQLEILQVAKGNIDSLRYINKLRFKNEVITQTDLYRTELLAQQYGLQIKTAQQQLFNQQKELQVLVGSTDSLLVDNSDHFLPPVAITLDSLLKQSEVIRGDIQSTLSLIEASNSNIKLQRSLAYPQPELGIIANPQNAVPYVGIYATIDLPVFDRNQGEIKKAYAIHDQAEQQLSAIRMRAQTEITNAYNNYKLQEKNVENFAAVLEQSRQILDNIQYAYLKGGTTIIDFLEAQRSWLETQQQYFEALQLYRESHIQLLYSTGLINQLAQ